MPRLRQLCFHVGSSYAEPGDSDYLQDKYPSVQYAAYSVVSHFYWHLGQLDLKDAAKLILEASSDVKKLDISNYTKELNVRTLLIPTNLSKAEKLVGDRKKRFILDEIRKSLLWLANQLGVETTSIESAYEKVIEDGLQFGFYHQKGKSWTDAKSKKKCKLYIKLDSDKSQVLAEVYEGRKLAGHVLMHETVPVESPLPSLAKEVHWTKSGDICLETIDFQSAKRLKVTKSVDDLSDGPASEAGSV